MSDLPAEVVADILSRLPVDSLLKFRSISKSWRSLIDSDHFMSLHLNNSLNFKSNNHLILRHDTELYQVNFPNLGTAVNLNHPLMCYSNRINLLGSCNGLLCISNIADDFAFWNPSLRKHRIIPYLATPRRPEPDTTLFAARVHGFGFDPYTGDYKLVRISYFVDLHHRTFDSQVSLFSSRINSWKSLPSMPYALCCARTMGVFVDHALHWVVTRRLVPGEPDLIVAFDLRFEVFGEVPLPEIGENSEGFEIDVAKLRGCLCNIVNYQNIKVDVWMMKEYGSKDSWCKVITLVESLELRSLKSVKPLGYSSDGIKVLFEQQDRKKLFWYNPRNENVSFVTIPGIKKLNECMICVGSLVSPFLPSESSRKKNKLRCENSARKRRDDFLSQGFKLTL